MLFHPAGFPVAVQFDTDCDGTSISFYDCEHPDVTRLSYGELSADSYIRRSDFERLLAAVGDDWNRSYWRLHGYFSDRSGIRNCEIARPVTPSTVALLRSMRTADLFTPLQHRTVSTLLRAGWEVGNVYPDGIARLQRNYNGDNVSVFVREDGTAHYPQVSSTALAAANIREAGIIIRLSK